MNKYTAKDELSHTGCIKPLNVLLRKNSFFKQLRHFSRTIAFDRVFFLLFMRVCFYENNFALDFVNKAITLNSS